MQATDVKAVDIEAVMARHSGVRGLTQWRRTLRLVDGGAESPYESLTRLLLVQAGFPALQTQLEVIDRYGFVCARIDMGWREWLVGVEFDRAQHWTDSRQRTRDIDRLAELLDLGWTIVRVSSGMLHNTPQVISTRVGAALIARGCSKTW
jgi:very-short-patch-repair endonuclease